MSKAKIIGAAAGIAAAAAATAAVVVKRGGARKVTEEVTEKMKTVMNRSGKAATTVYHVMRSGEQWAVQADGAGRASSLHPNKKEALAAARSLASSKAPSRLVIHRVDGSVQDEHEYLPEPRA